MYVIWSLSGRMAQIDLSCGTVDHKTEEKTEYKERVIM